MIGRRIINTSAGEVIQIDFKGAQDWQAVEWDIINSLLPSLPYETVLYGCAGHSRTIEGTERAVAQRSRDYGRWAKSGARRHQVEQA